MQMPFSKCSGGPLAWLKCNTVPTPNASEHPLHCPKSRPYTKGARWADGELSEGDARHRPHRRVLVMDSDPWAVHLPRVGQPALECGEEHFKDVVALLAVLAVHGSGLEFAAALLNERCCDNAHRTRGKWAQVAKKHTQWHKPRIERAP